MTRGEALAKAHAQRSANGHARKATSLAQALAIQWAIFECCVKKQKDHSALASLARSWCLVTDTIRELKGLPKSGQLRPDLDPVQMQKALKRIKARLPVEIQSGDAVMDGPEPELRPPKAIAPDPNAPETSKESLSQSPTVPTPDP